MWEQTCICWHWSASFALLEKSIDDVHVCVIQDQSTHKKYINKPHGQETVEPHKSQRHSAGFPKPRPWVWAENEVTHSCLLSNKGYTAGGMFYSW